MDNSMSILKENTVVSIVFRDKAGKVLSCKQEHTGIKFALPLVEVKHLTSTSPGKEWKDYMKQLIELMAKEFGVKVKKFSFIANDRMVYKKDGVYIMGDHLSFMAEEEKPHKGSTEPTANPSGVYTDVQYIEFPVIEEKFKKQEFDSSTFCALFFCNRKHQINRRPRKDEFKSLLGT
ncbi:MAG: hypothetical protein ACRC0G_01585, partial [Fusobacteriaceae bacterium]